MIEVSVDISPLAHKSDQNTSDFEGVRHCYRRPDRRSSSAGGKLDITREDGGEAWFFFKWVESGGPPVTPPTRRGLGVRAIERMLAQAIEGNARLEFDPNGPRCSIEAPTGLARKIRAPRRVPAHRDLWTGQH
jgi:hypothetical protein